MNDKSAFLEVTTWVGIEPEASHYSGKLVFQKDGERKTCTIERILTEAECIGLNRKERGPYPIAYKPGQESGVFLSRSSLEITAVEFVNKNLPEVEVVFWGRSRYCSAEGILMGPSGILETANKLYQRIKDLLALEDEKHDKERLGLYRELNHLLKDWE